MALTSKQTLYLRALAHPLKPLVQVGNKGISETLIQQVAEQLLAHELVKVRFNTDSVDPAEVMQALTERTESELVQKLGRMLVLYRAHETKPKIELPGKAHRAAATAKGDAKGKKRRSAKKWKAAPRGAAPRGRARRVVDDGPMPQPRARRANARPMARPGSRVRGAEAPVAAPRGRASRQAPVPAPRGRARRAPNAAPLPEPRRRTRRGAGSEDPE